MVPPDVSPSAPDLRATLRLAAAFAGAVFLFHLLANLWQTHLGYGYFRDEFYYIACGRHLAWGYVDHGPLVALQARLAETLLGHSLAGLRAFAALAGALRVVLTGLLCWALGGRLPAQALAMTTVAVAPQYLGIDGVLAMNSWESFFWMTALLALLLIVRSADSGTAQRWWLLFGAAAGLGLLNKPSMAFFLIALLLVLLLTPQRRLLVTPWAAAGIALMLLLIAPYLHWQAVHDWPMWEFLQNGREAGKNRALSPLAFLFNQLLVLDPVSAFVWLPGLVLLLKRPALRYLGLTYLLFLVIMLTLHAKDYYVTPIYPLLFAAGGLAWETRYATRPRVAGNHPWAFRRAMLTLTAISLAVLPMDTPILRPEAWRTYARVTRQYNSITNSENVSSGPLEQFYADRFGWQEMVDQVRRTYQSLTPAEQAQTVILCDNYGEAGALNFLAPELPTAIAGQNNFWLWGPGTRPGTILIDVEDTTASHLHVYYNTVQQVGVMDHPYAMPFEHKPIFLCKGAHQTIQSIWPDKKNYI